MHIDDGTQRALADGAVAEPERSKLEAHLADCLECRARQEAAVAERARMSGRLDVLSPASGPTEPSVALRRFNARYRTEVKETNMFKRIFSRRLIPAWSAAAIVLALVLALSIEPVRVWAGQFLSIFRVQQVTVLPIDTTGLSQIGTNAALAQEVSQAISKSVTVTKQPGKPQTVADAAAASKAAGFAVRLPASRTDAPRLTVNGESAFTIVADRAKAQTVLDETGHQDLVLPQSLDGAVIKVDVPASVSAAYGDCPQIEMPTVTQSGKPAITNGSAGRRMINCIILVEMPSPTVNTPPNLDVQQLVQVGLQFTGMTTEQAKAYSQTVDWASTLVIPIPRNAASYKEVTVDGVKGYLIRRPVDDAPGYGLIWVKDGIIYAISGLQNDVQPALDMAGSLQ